MTPQDDAAGPRRLDLGPEGLDGHTIEELTDYLEAGRVPADPSIDGSPACQLALDALERLRGLTPALIAADTAAEPEADDGWVARVLGGIALEAHAGRRIPLTPPEPHADLGITEGAVRGLIRAAENAVPGVLVGRCRFEGDVTELGAPVRVLVDASVPYGEPLPRLADELRLEIAARLRVHTELNVTAIDITVRDVRRHLS
ncbi:hypothetical protein AB1046_08145 [Promicromonospora sp. Populi]|uniref:hypothetical protein n=1 Tax=Promicromonospora sp. Populi TaxID=3239420 RepID=UPI0034E1BD8C